jgi:hypothetical protein
MYYSPLGLTFPTQNTHGMLFANMPEGPVCLSHPPYPWRWHASVVIQYRHVAGMLAERPLASIKQHQATQPVTPNFKVNERSQSCLFFRLIWTNHILFSVHTCQLSNKLIPYPCTTVATVLIKPLFRYGVVFGFACYHAVQNPLSSHVPTLNIRIRKTRNYNFICWFLWVWYLVTLVKVRTQIEGDWERNVQDNT